MTDASIRSKKVEGPPPQAVLRNADDGGQAVGAKRQESDPDTSCVHRQESILRKTRTNDRATGGMGQLSGSHEAAHLCRGNPQRGEAVQQSHSWNCADT